jgi:hypothetical protein
LMRNRRIVLRTLAIRPRIPPTNLTICRGHAIAQMECVQIDRWGFEFF